MKTGTKEALDMAYNWCRANDKSDAFMIQFLQDNAKVNLDAVVSYLKKKHKNWNHVPTHSHSEETEPTENAGKHTPAIEASGNAIHYIGKSECFAICPVRNGDHDEADNRANLLVTAVNSYATLKAENERLKKTHRADNLYNKILKADNFKLQSDNEAKDKRIEELEALLNRAHSEFPSTSVYLKIKRDINKVLTNK